MLNLFYSVGSEAFLFEFDFVLSYFILYETNQNILSYKFIEGQIFGKINIATPKWTINEDNSVHDQCRLCIVKLYVFTCPLRGRKNLV